MMAYTLIYSQASREQIRSLHPDARAIIKRRILDLRDNPFCGKTLERELSGYYSLRTKRYRVIYKILQESNTVQIHYVGHRKDIYEILKEKFTRED